MHTYLDIDEGKGRKWWVGYWPAHEPGPFVRVRAFEHEGQAAAYCSYLNGGSPPYRLLSTLDIHPDTTK